jgi:hypothetical protein
VFIRLSTQSVISAKHNHFYFYLSITTRFGQLSHICQVERPYKITASREYPFLAMEQRMLRHLQLRQYWALSFVLWQKVA